jgi:hypothetical protein
MAEETIKSGPPHVGLFWGFVKILAGMFGGAIGTLILTAVFLLSSSILNTVFVPAEDTTAAPHPLFIFIFMAMIFLAALSANIISSLFLAFTDKERYTKISTSIYQIFILNIIIFVLTVPIYIITSSISLPLTGFAAVIHVLITTFASALILEIMARPKYALLGIYGVIIGILISLSINFIIYYFSDSNPLILLFLAIPITWTSIALSEGIFYGFYYSIFQNYGTDFLSLKTEYGADIGAEEEAAEEAEEEPVKQDVAGTDFLKQKDESAAPTETPAEQQPPEQNQNNQ